MGKPRGKVLGHAGLICVFLSAIVFIVQLVGPDSWYFSSWIPYTLLLAMLILGICGVIFSAIALILGFRKGRSIVALIVGIILPVLESTLLWDIVSSKYFHK